MYLQAEALHVDAPPTEADAPTIVVGYDGDDASLRAVVVAAERAGPDGTLVVVHVTEPVGWMATPYREHATARRRLVALRALAKLTDAGGITTGTVEPEVIEGRPAEALMRIAQGRNAREIVIGSRGHGRFRAMFGSVSHRLLEHADRPVVVVPADVMDDD